MHLPDTDKIVQFLNSAPVIEVYGTLVKCKLCEAELPVGIRSDGVLAWPLDLPHYVKSHGIVLPNRFVERIRGLNYISPTKCDKERKDLAWPSAKGK